jgi:hypothetical protein
MMFDAQPDWPPTPGFLRRYVPGAAAVHHKAVAAGGTSVTEVTHLSFGDRVERVRDPLGSLWWIQTRIEDLTPAGEGTTPQRPGIRQSHGTPAQHCRPREHPAWPGGLHRPRLGMV